MLGHTGIVSMIREGECREYALDAGHVLADPALQSSPDGAVPTFEGARGPGVNTSEFGLLTEDKVLIWEASTNCRTARRRRFRSP
jgi:hypothetical protein